MRVKFTNQQTNGEKPDLRDKHGFCMLSTFERNKHPYKLDLFDDNFDHLHVNVVTFVLRKQSKKATMFFPQKLVVFFVEKVFDMYLLVGLSSLFSQIAVFL